MFLQERCVCTALASGPQCTGLLLVCPDDLVKQVMARSRGHCPELLSAIFTWSAVPCWFAAAWPCANRSLSLASHLDFYRRGCNATVCALALELHGRPHNTTPSALALCLRRRGYGKTLGAFSTGFVHCLKGQHVALEMAHGVPSRQVVCYDEEAII